MEVGVDPPADDARGATEGGLLVHEGLVVVLLHGGVESPGEVAHGDALVAVAPADVEHVVHGPGLEGGGGLELDVDHVVVEAGVQVAGALGLQPRAGAPVVVVPEGPKVQRAPEGVGAQVVVGQLVAVGRQGADVGELEGAAGEACGGGHHELAEGAVEAGVHARDAQRGVGVGGVVDEGHHGAVGPELALGGEEVGLPGPAGVFLDAGGEPEGGVLPGPDGDA